VESVVDLRIEFLAHTTTPPGWPMLIWHLRSTIVEDKHRAQHRGEIQVLSLGESVGQRLRLLRAWLRLRRGRKGDEQDR
jgi:hypothetical protein